MSLEPSVPCPRLGRKRTTSEHADCPYCFGTQADVATGQRAKFCDFDPARDPVTFGFPDGLSRHRAG